MNKLILLFLLVLCASCKLYQVVSLTRHGARYHVNDFGDGNDSKPLWGQLTAVGRRQHQNLGKIFRQQYINKLKFLSPTYNSSQIEVYATPYNRTIISTLSQLYGVYPQKTGPRLTYVDRSLHIPPYSNKTDDQQQNYALPHGHQPIPVKLNDKVMLSNCPNFGKYQHINMQIRDTQVKEMNMTYFPFFKKLAPMYNFSLSSVTFYTMLRVWDCVNVDNYLGRPLPKNLTTEDQKNVLHLASWYFDILCQGNNSIMFSSGKLQKVLSVFDMRIRLPNTYALKWSFLGGHDTDIFALYNALNLSSADCIQQLYRKGNTSALNCQDGGNLFASSLIFELHSDDQKTFYVKIRSNGKYMYLCSKKSTQCEYNQFKNLAKKSITNNIEQICGRKVSQQTQFISVSKNPNSVDILEQ